MKTIRLRYSDQLAAYNAFKLKGYTRIAEETSNEYIPNIIFVEGVRCDIDIIGKMYKPTGMYDADNNEIYKQLSGYHINLLYWSDALLTVVEGEIMYPDTPIRDWQL